jgi:hypothetical protein
MALVIPGPLVEVLSGKVGGVCFLNGSTYKAVRGLTKQTRSRSPLMSNIQSHVSIVLSAWRDLSSAQQLEWTSTALRFPHTSRVGTTYFLTGYQFFMSLNLKLLSTGFTVRSVDDIDDLIDEYTYEELLGGPQSLIASFDVDSLRHNYVVNMWAAPPGSSGRYKSNISFYKLVKVADSLANYEVRFIQEYSAVFGLDSLKVGSTIYTFAEIMDSTSGLCTSRQFRSCRIVAA